MVTPFSAGRPGPAGNPNRMPRPPKGNSPGTRPPGHVPAGRKAHTAPSKPGAAKPPPKGKQPPPTPNHPAKTQPAANKPNGTHTFSPNHNAPDPTGLAAQEVNHRLKGMHAHAGLAFASGQALLPSDFGHHPVANGRGPFPSLRHGAATKRARILSYNSTTNTAIVQFGDTPDSPTLSIPVGAGITAAEIGAASMAGVDLWSDDDPTDMLISQVL